MSPTIEHLLVIQAAARVIDDRAATLTPTHPAVAERIHCIVYSLLDALDETVEESAHQGWFESMNDLVVGGSTALTEVASPAVELQLVARQPEEMQRSQQQLVAWFDQKIAACRREAADANDNLAIAQRSGWKLASFRRQSQLACRRIVFYEKCKAAVEAGYALVPNFPVDVFAVRTIKPSPRGEEMTWNAGFPQKGEGAPLGAGEYVSDLPFVEHRIDHVDDGKGDLRKVDRYWPGEFDEEIEHPLSIALPAVMSATAEALARRIFDEVGSLPERRRKGDPIVVGRICGSLGGVDRKMTPFLIARYIDTRELQSRYNDSKLQIW